MPELPEVETIRRQLQKNMVGKTIKVVEVQYPKVVHGMSTADFVRAMHGRKVREVGRQGKLILIRLEGNETLVVHLKMTGRLLLQSARHPEPRRDSRGEGSLYHGMSKRLPRSLRSLAMTDYSVNKSTEVIFTFTNGSILRYDDLRRFGYMKVVPTSEEAKVVQKEQLGIDFFDRVLTVQKFKELIRARGGSQIKPLLLDQSLIAGVGNIYAQEACFMAKIHPLRKVSSLNDAELNALYRALQTIMKKAIVYGGTTADDYRDAYGKEGKFAVHLKVYGRQGKPCLRCKGKLIKSSIGGRGTVFCPKCQK
ncbi:bifunctional DNA-formamidopyrimidine glycosylase/DNA-(apurinic or apyrimidinic site) lyase [Candidatus Uhrbacteria bacterium]|nr:bifunctional DNA-formamidopyrimidine glycosylase/DNA-(apurinic or apyrimidinic site) lyase [Candidatus Uhrbacteria bacterium]